jgi:CrcB protein
VISTASSSSERRKDGADHQKRIAVIAAGGMVGSSARYGVGVALPTAAGHLPLGTLLVNISGCLLIGILMVLIVDVWSAHPLVRPFLGVGVLGGYTTFSAATVEVQGLITAGRTGLALGYLVGTAVAAVAAVQVGVILTRAVALRPSTRESPR